MSGLRERQRADRHRRILEAGAALFRQSGYEGAKIEAIAADAGVSVGTIYNYYRNKGDILVAIVSMEVNEVLNAGRGVVSTPPANVADAIDTLIGIYIDHSLIYLSKEMWRQAMATSTQQPDSPFGKTYTALDRGLADQTCELVQRLRALGLVRPDVDIRSAGEVIFNNMNMMFTDFVKDDAMTLGDLRAAIRRQNKVLVDAIATREG
ncbi:MAG: TetR/AcrR family transcriptional regulator [Rhizobiaceae bacterium]|nr:TetR/AcrR family transcriptional regulator [Rhizobiaceae bacterium]